MSIKTDSEFNALLRSSSSEELLEYQVFLYDQIDGFELLDDECHALEIIQVINQINEIDIAIAERGV